MIIILLGAPGSGKGTIAKLIHKKHQFPIVSSGEMLRTEMNKGTDIGKQVSHFVLSGKLVPDEIINSLIKKRIKQLQYEKSVVLDGYPRNQNQVLALNKILKSEPVVFYLDIPKNILVDRLLNRGRIDDIEKIIKQRFEVYLKETQPLINYYTQKNILVKINEDSSMKIFRKIETII
ncbi:Adenylate kinase [Carnobacterium iners]|uniref:Adenylate kinase n=1 Tax=Carnobacterium iners TaxID=1073423 RepID=A0A1X7MTW4_9LACT|nr:nucleoside monophosphate kinase [Carnobacterium iners]SEK56552.1 Adenylate kinase [Carnobacterium iners]SMH28186.1 Adenylate kinase [Carnobacterium iners]